MHRVFQKRTPSNKWKEQDQYIARLDPLGMDGALKVLPVFNKGEDTRGMVQMLYRHLPIPMVLNSFDYSEAIAAMRDIGMLLGSLKRHGVEPVEAVPELDYILGELSHKTDLPPRDTLIHYSSWNPSGNRMRTYTDTEDEKYLIRSVQIAMHPLLESIYGLIKLYHTALDDPGFVELCEEINEHFKAMVEGIVLAKRKVSPLVFANELRFYFDPITLYGQTFIGPGAVEMPVFVFDHVLWSTDSDDPGYIAFKTTYLPFVLPEIREIYYDFDQRDSLVKRIKKELEQDSGFSPEKVDAAKAVLRLFTTLKSFRKPHKKLADKAYEQQDDHHRSTGSGGYSTLILSEIILMTVQQCNALDKAIGTYCSRFSY